MSSATEAKSTFTTVVRTVPRFPLPMVVFTYLLLLFNLLGLVLFLFSINGIVPGLAGLSSGTVQQLSYRIAGRQLIPILLFVFALTYKDVRVFQLAWAMALIREISDVAGFLATGESVFVLLIIYALFMVGEIAAFVYLGRIASGHVTKYLPQGLHMT